MNRKEVTQTLSQLLEHHINPNNDPRVYWAREVTFNYGSQKQKRVDYMKFEPLNNSVSGLEHGDFICYEIKSCVQDFKSSHGHNFFGDINYYVMPYEVYMEVKKEINYYVGVYCPDSGKLSCVKQAHRHDREYSALQTLFMMFRSANRDRLKGEAKV